MITIPCGMVGVHISDLHVDVEMSDFGTCSDAIAVSKVKVH